MSILEIKQEPLNRIKDTEVIELHKAKLIKLKIGITKAKKGAKKQDDTYSQTLIWISNGQPVLSPSGKIDCVGDLLWGVQPPERRNTLQDDADPRFDKCEMSGGSKTSGTLGALMLYWGDVIYPEAIEEFSKSPEHSDLFPADCTASGNSVCKKKAGSNKTPATPAVQAAYTAAGDFTFPIKFRIEKFTKDKTPIPGGRLFMTKLVEYVSRGGVPVEQEIKVNSKNIHLELTRGSRMMFCMRPANCHCAIVNTPKGTFKTFHPAFDWPHMVRIKKGLGSAIQNAERPTNEILATLAAAGVVLSEAGAPPGDQNSYEPDDDEGYGANQASQSDSKGGAPSCDDITKQLEGTGL